MNNQKISWEYKCIIITVLCNEQYGGSLKKQNKKNEFESAKLRWMNLEPVSTEGSKLEREKQILYINLYI